MNQACSFWHRSPSLIYPLDSPGNHDADMDLQSQYEYYSDNNEWWTNSSSPAAIFTLETGAQLQYGNVFWSPFYQTWMSIFMSDWQNEFFITYSTTGKVEGPYVKSYFIFETCPTMPTVDCHNYAGTAYPYWRGADASEVLLSWTVTPNGMKKTQMGLITFS